MSKFFPIVIGIALCVSISACNKISTGDETHIPAETVLQTADTLQISNVQTLKEDYRASYPAVLHEDEHELYLMSMDPVAITTINKETLEAATVNLEGCGTICSYIFTCYQPQLDLLLISGSNQTLCAFSLEGELCWEIAQPGDLSGIAAYQDKWVFLSQGMLYSIDETGTITSLFEIPQEDDKICLLSFADDTGATINSFPNTPFSPLTFLIYNWEGKLIVTNKAMALEQACTLYIDDGTDTSYFIGVVDSEAPPSLGSPIEIWSFTSTRQYSQLGEVTLPDGYSNPLLKYSCQQDDLSYIFGDSGDKHILLVIDKQLQVQSFYEWPAEQNATILWGEVKGDKVRVLTSTTLDDYSHITLEVSGLNYLEAVLP